MTRVAGSGTRSGMLSRSWSNGPWAILLLALTLSNSLRGAESAALLNLTDSWKYEDSGADLGSAWRTPGYNDSLWPAGPGVLAREDTPIVLAMTGTTLTRQGTNGQFKVTDYFRTRFTVPAIHPGWRLVASNLVDDGAVYYLNGAELFRLRMPEGEVTATTLASETIDVGREGLFVVTEHSAAGLVAGENVLAVEVHQPYLTSSDVAFGLALFYAPQEPLVIRQQPVNRTLTEGETAVLQAAVTGSLPRWQWYKDGSTILGATQATLRLNDATRADAAQYHVVISNDVSAVTSRVVSLTMILDRQPPALVSAQKNFFLDVTFTEDLDEGSVADLDNYRLTGPGGTTVPILAAYPFSHGVSLETGPLTPGLNYEVFVTGVRDRVGNNITPNSGIALTITITNVPLDSIWKFDDTGLFPGGTWKDPAHDDASWAGGAALLYNDANLNLQAPGVRRTFINVTNQAGPFWTHYFRHRFTNNASPVSAQFHLRHYLDDGAVFYLNGQEMRRVNMASGTVEHTTRASASATEGLFSSPVTFVASNLLVGPNVLAVEVHQFSLASPNTPDISFGVELTADVTSRVEGPPRVLSEPDDLDLPEGAMAVFRAHVAAAESVQWLRNGVPLAGETGPTLMKSPVIPLDHQATFTLQASNALGVVFTRAARLTVQADSFPPRLLRAEMGTNANRVTLTFSEALDPITASVPQNYSIADALGESLVVLSATLTNGTNVIIVTAEPRIEGGRYGVVVTDVHDAAAAGNSVIADARIGIDYEIPLMRYTHSWRYNDSGTNLDVAWRESGYDDAAWAVGPGLLGFESGPLPLPILTTLPPPELRGITYYFRTAFDFSGDPVQATLRLRHLIDDGAVFYLNGLEVHRIRVPEGQNYQTVTPQGVEAQVEGSFALSTTALLSGVNVLAVEVHQNSAVSADVVFGAELVLAYPADPPGPASPVLHLNANTTPSTLSWNAPDFALESAGQLDGPWSPVTKPIVPYPVSPTNSARFYRLRSDAP